MFEDAFDEFMNNLKSEGNNENKQDSNKKERSIANNISDKFNFTINIHACKDPDNINKVKLESQCNIKVHNEFELGMVEGMLFKIFASNEPLYKLLKQAIAKYTLIEMIEKITDSEGELKEKLNKLGEEHTCNLKNYFNNNE